MRGCAGLALAAVVGEIAHQCAEHAQPGRLGQNPDCADGAFGFHSSKSIET